MTDTARSTWIRYGGAALAVLLAAGVRLALHPSLGNRQPFATLILALILTAWFAGLGPSLLALSLGGIAGGYFLLVAPGPPAAAWLSDLLGALLYLVVGSAIVAFGEASRAARRRLEAEVDERRRVEAAERAHREQLRATLDSIGDAVIATDAEGVVVFLNPVAEGLTGWESGEAAGRPLGEVLRLVHEETGEPVDSPLPTVLREKRNVGLASGTALVARDGSLHLIEDSAAPICDACGKISGFVLVFRDVTGRRAVEAALEERERQLRFVADNAPVLIAHCDLQRRYKFVNRAYADRFGLRPEEIYGRSVSEVLGQGASAVIEPHIATALSGRRVEFETDVPYEGLGTLHMQCAYQPEFDAAGQVVGWVAAIIDVSGRKWTERRLRFQAHLLDAVGQAVIATDPQGRIIYWNRFAESLYGWSAAEAEGRSILDLVVPPESAGRSAEIMRLMLEGESWSGEIHVRRRDGSTFPAYVTDTPMFDSQGALEAIIGVSSDISERKQAEERLRDSERRFARFMEHLPGLAWIKDAQGRYVYANDAAERAFRTPRESLYGRTDAELFQPRTASQFRENDRRAIAAGAGVQSVETLEHADGLVHHSLVSKFPMPGPGGEAALVGGIAIDITDRLRAEEATQASEGRFRGLMEQAPFCIQIFDPNGRTLAVNRAWEELWGIGLDQMADYNVLDDPQLEARGVMPYIIRAFSGEPTSVPAIEYDPNETIPDRTRYADARRWVSAVAYPLKDSAGLVREVVLFHEDITERRRAEEALREAEARLAAIVDHSPAYIFVKDWEGRYLLANRALARLVGRHPDDFPGRTDLEFFPPEVARQFNRDDRDILETGQPRTFEETFVMGESSITALTVKFPLRDAAGAAFAVCGIAADMTELKRTEEALRTTAERLGLALAAARLGDWSWDAATDVVTLSDRAAEIFGIPPGPHMTWSEMQERLHIADRERTRAAVERSVSERSQYEVDYRVLRPDGTEVWVAALGRAIQGPTGEALGMFGVVQDITARKRTEEAVRASEQRLRLALEAGRMGTWDWDLRSGEVAWSDNMEEVHGLPIHDFDSTLEGFSRLVHPGDRGRIEATLAKAIENLSDYEAEFRIARADGSVGWMLGLGKVFADETGRAARMIGVGMDITGRKQGEAAVREAEARLAAVVTHSPAIIFLKDREGRYLLANRRFEELARSWGIAGPYLGRTDAELLPAEVARKFRQDDLQVMKSCRVENFEETAELGGEERTSLTTKFPLLDETGVAYAVGGITLDITERKRAEEALREADRRKGEFLATLAHELRNPLAPLLYATHLLRLPGANGPPSGRLLEMIERQIRHMSRLVEDLLDVSRIDRGKIELRIEDTDLVEVARRACEMCRPQTQERSLELSIVLPDRPIWIEADPTRLEQVLGNLLNNAVKYSDPGGRIDISIEAQGDRAVIRVRDTGIGLDPAMLPKIFDLFVQVERRTARSQGGLGIGLSLVKRLVELHGGRVSAHSDGLGRGSEFVVWLPVRRKSEVEAPLSDTDPHLPNSPIPIRRRILVVDDNRDAADSLGRLLGQVYGQEVRVAYDGPSALEFAPTFRPDLVLLDLGLPEMDGYEIARRLRARSETREVILVALTGRGQEVDRQSTALAGFDDHLVKPVDPVRLEHLLAGPRLSEDTTEIPAVPR